MRGVRRAVSTLAQAAVITAVAGALSSAAAQERCEFEDTREVTLAAGDVATLEIVAGSGFLDVRGGTGSNVRAVAVLCASDEEYLRDMDLSLDRSGDRAWLETHYPDRNGGGWGRDYARIDLRVEVPATLSLEVTDGSGSVDITNVGALRMRDGSGSLVIEGVRGDLELQDGSGDVDIRDVGGDVDLRDGSGGVDIVGVEGHVVVRDGSGGLDIREVGMSVRVRSKGSGSIDVAGVGGDFTVESGRRERIRYRDVRGAVDLPPERRRRGRRF